MRILAGIGGVGIALVAFGLVFLTTIDLVVWP